MSAASGLAAAKNRRCKDGPIVKVQGKPVACAPNTSCSRTSAPPAAMSTRGRSAPASAQVQTATASPAQVQSAKDIAELLAGRNARELANGMKIPAGPLKPMQIMQLHELRLIQLESDMTQIVQVIADASDAQAQLDAAAGAGAASTTVDALSFACASGDVSGCQNDITDLFARCDELDDEVANLNTELQQTKTELQQTKVDFFKVQTFAMEAHMMVTKLAAEVQRLQQQQQQALSPAPLSLPPVSTEAPSPTPISLNISDISPTFTIESMHY